MTLRGDLVAASVSLPTYDVLARYRSEGTRILIASLPQSGGERLIQDIVLSPTINPYGTTDAAGIYWIDASGEKVRIANCRLDATLVISDANEVLLSGGLAWSYPRTPDAILVCDSKITIENLESTLSEPDRNSNFNPLGSPYRDTLTNGTTFDTYPTELRGLVYTTKDILIKPLVGNGILPVTGSLLGDKIQIEGAVSVQQLDEWIDTPPIGFSDQVPMQFVRGTFRRIPSP
jgi:hypothetical protein